MINYISAIDYSSPIMFVNGGAKNTLICTDMPNGAPLQHASSFALSQAMSNQHPQVVTTTNQQQQQQQLTDTKIPILIKPKTGRTFTLRVDTNHTVASVKGKIQNKKGIPTHQQVLVLNGEALNDNRTLRECNVQKESTIYLDLREDNTNNLVPLNSTIFFGYRWYSAGQKRGNVAQFKCREGARKNPKVECGAKIKFSIVTVLVHGEKFRYIDTRQVTRFIPHASGCMYEGSNNTIRQVTAKLSGGRQADGQMDSDSVGQNEEIELRDVVSLLAEAIPLMREAIPLFKQAIPLLREIVPVLRGENRTEESGSTTIGERTKQNSKNFSNSTLCSLGQDGNSQYYPYRS